MRQLPERNPAPHQARNLYALLSDYRTGHSCVPVELQLCQSVLTMSRCRGWCVRSECARDKAPRLLLCIVLLIELVRIDLGHVSARVSCLPISVLIQMTGTRWTSSRPGCEQHAPNTQRLLLTALDNFRVAQRPVMMHTRACWTASARS